MTKNNKNDSNHDGTFEKKTEKVKGYLVPARIRT